MPDENSAATEHAIIQEVTAPLATLPENPVPAVADVDFPVVLRGYDRLAVDAYVKQTSQLVAELQATRSPESAVRRALERVGEEVSGILQRAHDAAGQITSQSRSEAEDRLEVARQEAVQITADARHRLKDLDVETDRIWAERQRIVEDAQDLARQLLALAESAADRFPAAEEPGSAQAPGPPGGSGQPAPPAAGTPAGERKAGADRPAPDGEPGGREDDAEPEGRDPAPPPTRAGDGTTEPLEGEATVIMPPIKPDEDQHT